MWLSLFTCVFRESCFHRTRKLKVNFSLSLWILSRNSTITPGRAMPPPDDRAKVWNNFQTVGRKSFVTADYRVANISHVRFPFKSAGRLKTSGFHRFCAIPTHSIGDFCSTTVDIYRNFFFFAVFNRSKCGKTILVFHAIQSILDWYCWTARIGGFFSRFNDRCSSNSQCISEGYFF